MVRITKKAAHPVPDILLTKGITLRDALNARYNSGERSFGSADFDSSIYGHTQVKAALIEVQGNKCCFCESKIGHISYGDVEHFRPKAGWVQDNEPINRPGYYWTAYEWDNLLLSCQLCNQRHKKNFFPLANPTQRATSHQMDIKDESPLFIHPSNENPEDYIAFKDEIPVAVGNNTKGDATIKKLGLDRELLNEQRRQKLNPIRIIYELAKGMPETEPGLKNRARNELIKFDELSKRGDTEYASMLRSFFIDNPIDF